MTVFLLCSGCQRHFRQGEASCPFCGTSAVGLLPKRPPPLASGASRAQRYAASAALIAGSAAVFSCGSSDTANQQTSNGASSGGASNSTASNSTASNSTTSNTTNGGNSATSSASGTTQGTSATSSGNGTNGGITTDGGTTGGNNTGRACPGHTDTAGCRADMDCDNWAVNGYPRIYCAMAPISNQGCGNPSFLPMCPIEGCEEGSICVTLDACGSQACQAECSEETCSEPTHCVDGLCQPIPCDMPGGAACGENYRCDSANSVTPDGCVPIRCTEDASLCEPWQSCFESGGNAFGCGLKGCATDEDCGDCGYCVGTSCQPTLGTCYQELPAMPYGCVWPDEELV